MKQYKFTFVILHYLTMEDTIDCIESIRDKCRNFQYRIIVVDNASPNNSGRKLEKKYKDDSDIKVVVNRENVGFARGNNIGFKIAKEDKSDFIILCNNDTKLLQDNFLKLIVDEYENSLFAVLGPKILLKDNSVNDVNLLIPSKKSIKKEILYTKLDYILNLFFIKNILNKIKRDEEKINKDYQQALIRYEDGIVLHGCFYIFSKQYIDMFDGLDDRTYMYGEEVLLFIRLKRNNLKSVYNPDIEILHKEDSSTNAYCDKNNRKKQLFKRKNALKSLKIILEDLKDE